MSQTSARLQQFAGAAVSTLVKVMVDLEAAGRGAGARRRLYLNPRQPGTGNEDLELRVAALERAAQPTRTST